MAVARQYIERDIYSEAEYFAIEDNSQERWEYVDGQIRMMAGGTTTRGTICTNLVRVLANFLTPRGCRVFNSDVKVHCADGTNTYPDASALCGPLAFHAGREDIYTNPLLIVEVLSPSTENNDRGEKFRHYQSIPTLRDYLIVAQDEARMTLHTRQGDLWEAVQIVGLDATLFLSSVNVTLTLADVYALTDLDPHPQS